MAKISNTTSYPNATAASTDYVIGTDVSDNDNTKTFTLQDIANLNAFSPGSGTVTSVGMSGASTGLTFTSDTVSPIVNTGIFTLGGSLGFANGGTGLTALGSAGQVLKVNALATGFEYGTIITDPGSGTIGRMSYWTSNANPGVLGSAPIKYTPASSNPVVNELTEIISNSNTHQIKIGTEANAGLVQLGNTNAVTIVRSSGTVQIDSGTTDGVVIGGGVLTNIATTSRAGTINIVNNNTNPATGAITSSINIGSTQNANSIDDAVNIQKPLYSHSDTFCVGTSNTTQLNVGFNKLAGQNFANQRFTVNAASNTTQMLIRGRTSDGSSILNVTNFDTYGTLGFNSNLAGDTPFYIINSSSQTSTINFGGPTNDQMILYVNDTKTNAPPTKSNGGLYVSGNFQIAGEYAIKAGASIWQSGSDERYKENIVDADLDICYNNIKSLKLKRFKYKEEVYRDPSSDTTKLGFLAQEVETIFPKSVANTELTTWVNYSGKSEILGSDGKTKIKPGDRVQDVLAGSVVVDDFKTMNEEQILRSMFGAFQKMQEKIESLEAKVKVLEG